MSLSFKILDCFTSKLPPHPATQKPQSTNDVIKAIRSSRK